MNYEVDCSRVNSKGAGEVKYNRGLEATIMLNKSPAIAVNLAK
jgi:hypothetical protein